MNLTVDLWGALRLTCRHCGRAVWARRLRGWVWSWPRWRGAWRPCHIWWGSRPGVQPRRTSGTIRQHQHFFSPVQTPAPAPVKSSLSAILIFFNNIPSSLLEKLHLFLSISFLISILSMMDRTERISFRTSSILSKGEPEPDLYTGSDRLRNTSQHRGSSPGC